MSTATFYAIAAGLVIGLVLGLAKAWLLWYRSNPFKQNTRHEYGIQGILARSLLSYIINIIILALIFLAQPLLPLPLAPLLITAATGLILCGLLYPVQNFLRKK